MEKKLVCHIKDNIIELHERKEYGDKTNLDLAFVKTLFLNLYEEEPMLPFNTNN